MNVRKKTTEASSKPKKLPDVPELIIDQHNKKKYKKGDLLGKVSIF